jgi:hypothetical protein
MNEARFIELLAAYGAELSRWPEDDRGDAEAFLEVAPHRIKDIWESERSFDHLLALEKGGPVSISLETRVISASPDRRRVRAAMNVPGSWSLPQWVAGGALAASLALGFVVGYVGEPAAVVTDAEYAKMLTVSGAGAGSMFITAMNDPEK